MVDGDPKRDSQLSRADDWLTEAIDPSKPEDPGQEESKQGAKPKLEDDDD